ncbi:hypothetical protein Tsubulata_041683, partial [Turnera subulata]
MQNPPFKGGLESILRRTVPVLVHDSKGDVLVWVENVKLISFDKLWGRIVMVVMCPIIFVPLVSGVNTVEIFRLSSIS